MSADQFNDFAGVADGPISEQKEQAGVSTEHRLPQDPVKWCQNVGAPHVCSDLPDIITGHSQGFLEYHTHKISSNVSVAIY